ncbi:olfactory receptor 49-like [Sciurus carolinensis]|uniref:olfactory receptor 49-like n=1 Tax=Sciurus carolinensis TaxID=30640 RepID=UPI001FB4591E|nr:olfactory receptor 49-like [Sciurus carolinensis]
MRDLVLQNAPSTAFGSLMAILAPYMDFCIKETSSTACPWISKKPQRPEDQGQARSNGRDRARTASISKSAACVMGPPDPGSQANYTSVLDFELLGVTDVRGLQLLLFGVLLVTYLLTLLGNLLIITLTLADHRLHIPMYYFLRHFSLLEVGFTSTVTPQMLVHLFSGSRTISRDRCFAQTGLYFILGTVESLLLAVMSGDRYLAICHPLHYSALMTPSACVLLVLACWGTSVLVLGVLCAWMFSLHFCGPHVLNHFFCDSTPLLELICSDTRLLQLVNFLVAICTLLSAVLLTVLSYGCILRTVLCMPASGGRRKVFSTCSSHMLVVSLSYGSCIIMYLNPRQTGQLTLNKGVAFFNTTLSPLLNPFIYCFRNELVQKASRDMLLRCRAFSSKIFTWAAELGVEKLPGKPSLLEEFTSVQDGTASQL